MAKVKHLSDGTTTWDVGGTEVFTAPSVWEMSITVDSTAVTGSTVKVTESAASITSPSGQIATGFMPAQALGMQQGDTVHITFYGTLPADIVDTITIGMYNFYTLNLTQAGAMTNDYYGTITNVGYPDATLNQSATPAPVVYDRLKVLNPLVVFNDGTDDCLALNNSGFAGSLDLTGDTLSLVTNNGTVMNSVTLASGAKKVNAYWSEETVLGTLCAKYERLVVDDETLNIGDIVIASSATLHECCYADLVALNTDGTGQSHFFIDIHGLQTSPLEQNGNSYSDINYISADRQWTFVVADTLMALDLDGNEYIKYVLIPYSMIPILDSENDNWSHTGRGLTDNTSDVADIAGKLLYSYGCGNITNAQPIDLVDSNGNTVSPDDSYLVIGANKEFTQLFKFNSGSNQVVGVKADYNSLCVPTSIYVTGSMGMPKSVPLYYDPTTGTYKLTNNVDLTNDDWEWFFVHGQYIS